MPASGADCLATRDCFAEGCHVDAVERGTGYFAVLGLGFAATLVVTTLVTRIARQALREAAGDTLA